MDEDVAYAQLKAYKQEKEAKKAAGTSTKHSVTKKKSAPLSESERRQMIAEGLLKKKECERNALDIVERLTATGIEQDWLRQAANYITPSHYSDATEERAIDKSCGYPLCDQPLGDMPKKKYHISTLNNKVYDLTERKKFCSNLCFKKSSFFLSQISSEPLWMRDPAVQVKPIVLYDEEKIKSYSGKGAEVNLTIVVPQSGEEEAGPKSDSPDTPPSPPAAELKRPVNRAKVETQSKKSESAARQPPQANVEKAFSIWYTIDSFRWLYGDDHVRNVLLESGCTLEKMIAVLGNPDYSAASHKDASFKEAYIRLCRKLDVMELSEMKEDQKNESATDLNQKLKPLPSYEKLQKEVEEGLYRVDSFLRGKTDYVLEKNVHDNEADSADSTVEARLPLVDNYAKMALRRRIFHDHLERIFPDILRICGLTSNEVKDSLRQLVLTFALDAEHIAANMNEWTLIAIHLLVMLQRNTPAIGRSLKDGDTRKKLNLMLLTFDTNMDRVEQYVQSLHGDITLLIGKLHYEDKEASAVI